MNYLNIHTDTLRGVDVIGAEPDERATWLMLLGWCATQENGGVIEDCESWRDRQWQQICGVTEEEVKTISKLYGFKDGNLVVNHYPIDAENAVKAKRESGKRGGRPKKVSKPPNPSEIKEENHMVNHDPNHQLNEKEGKGKKRNTCPQADESDFLTDLWEKAPKWSRQRSSKKQVADSWGKIPKRERPAPEKVILGIETWRKCEEWTRDGGRYAQGLHLWVNAQKWESLPEINGASARSKILTPDML